jgi:uncharacterized cupredoxin-like copper-binding protein
MSEWHFSNAAGRLFNLKGNPMLRQFLVFIILAAVLVLTACAGAASTAEVVITANANGFSPATVELAAGKPVMLTLNNASSAEHQLAIKEIPLVTTGGGMSGMSGDMAGMSEEMNDYQIHIVAPAGGTTTLELTPAKSGEYEFLCLAPGHTERGKLIVKSVR